MNRNRANNRDFRDQPRTFLVSELDRLTIPNTLMAYFDRFGTVEDVTLNEDDDGRTLGTATITFKYVVVQVMSFLNCKYFNFLFSADFHLKISWL